MATCKDDCIHYNVCHYHIDEETPFSVTECNNFKNKADFAEVKHGKWIRHEPNPEKMRGFHKQGIGVTMAENSIYWTCSICGDWGVPHNKYCRECGARMDVGKDNNVLANGRSDT